MRRGGRCLGKEVVGGGRRCSGVPDLKSERQLLVTAVLEKEFG